MAIDPFTLKRRLDRAVDEGYMTEREAQEEWRAAQEEAEQERMQELREEWGSW